MTHLLRQLGRLAVAAILALTACGGPPPAPPVQSLIGPAGGTVIHEGIKVTIPAGALKTDTAVTVQTKLVDAPSVYSATTVVVTVGDATLRFDKPATVQIPLTKPSAAPVVVWSAAGENVASPSNWDLQDGCDDVPAGVACASIDRGGTGFAVEALAAGRIGPAGGLVTGAGVTLDIPAGAVTANRTYSVLLNVVAAKAGETPITDVYSLGPSHTEDLKDYTLEVETLEAANPAAPVVAYFTKHHEPSSTPTVWEEHPAEFPLEKGRSKVRTQNNARSSVFFVQRGSEPTDGGTDPVDAGTPDPIDAGTDPVDAGTPDPIDAGTPDPIDAGTVPDPIAEPLEFPAAFALHGAGATGGPGAEIPLVFAADGSHLVAAAELPPGPVTQNGQIVQESGGGRRLAIFELTATSTALPSPRVIDLAQDEALASVLRCGTNSFAITQSLTGLRVIGQGATGGLAAATIQKTGGSSVPAKLKVGPTTCAGSIAIAAISTTADVDVTGPAGAVGGFKGSATALGTTGFVKLNELFGGGDLNIPTMRDIQVRDLAGASDGSFKWAVTGSSTGQIGSDPVGEGELVVGDHHNVSVKHGRADHQDLPLVKIAGGEPGGPVVIGGVFSGSLAIDGGPSFTTATGAAEAFVAVFPDGAAPIGKKGGGMSIDRIAPGPGGTIVVAGTHTAANAAFGLTAPVGTSDAFVAVLDVTLNPLRAAHFGAPETMAQLLGLEGEGSVNGQVFSQIGFVTTGGAGGGGGVIVGGKSELGFGAITTDGKRGFTAPASILSGGVTRVTFLGGEDVLLGYAASTQLVADGNNPQSPFPPLPPTLDGNGRSKVRTNNNAR